MSVNNLQELIELVDDYGANWESDVDEPDFDLSDRFEDFCDYLKSVHKCLSNIDEGMYELEGKKIHVGDFSVTVMGDHYFERLSINENLDTVDITFDDFDYDIASWHDMFFLRDVVRVFGDSAKSTIKSILEDVI